MKHMRKILALALALMLVLGLATTAYAAEKNDSITVTNAVNNETYKIYKMFDLVVDNELAPSAYTYTINDAWKAFFAAADAGAQYIVKTGDYVTEVTGPAALAAAAAKWAKEQKITPAKDPVVAANNEAKFDGLEDGYWLITSTLGTNAMIQTTPAAKDVTIHEKNPEDTIKKEVKEDDGETWGESNVAQIGATVNFKSTATLKPSTTNVKIYDAMDDGLTLDQNSIVVADLAKDTDYTVAFDVVEGGVTYDFVITFTQAYLDKLEDSTDLEITYNAVLNENAVKNNVITVQKNTTQITYGDKQSVKDETTTTTLKFSVHKHAKDSTANLAGAVFSLKKNGTVVNLIKIDNKNYRVAKNGENGAVTTFTTVADGDIVIWGVDSDNDYTLEEITAPDGYNKLTADVVVNWAEEEGKGTVIDVENNAGSVLPSTGGIGTTIFYVVGGLLVLAAIVLLVTKKRMASAK